MVVGDGIDGGEEGQELLLARVVLHWAKWTLRVDEGHEGAGVSGGESVLGWSGHELLGVVGSHWLTVGSGRPAGPDICS